MKTTCPCAVEDCGRESCKRGYCEMHYRRFMRFGDPGIAERLRVNNNGPCSVSNCGAAAYKRGLCNTHYLRKKRYGRTERLPGQPRRGTPPEPLGILTTKPRELWVAWAAGFVDGEGCIIIRTNRGGHSYHLRLTVPQTTPHPLRILQGLFGGTVTEKDKIAYRPTHKTKFLWSISARQAYEAILEMLPHLTVKREEADVAVEFQEGMGRAFSGGVSADERARRESLRLKLKELKRKDYGRKRVKH